MKHTDLHVDYFEFISIDGTGNGLRGVTVTILIQYSKNGEHRYIRLPCTRWSTHEYVLVGAIRGRKDYRLYPVQSFISLIMLSVILAREK